MNQLQRRSSNSSLDANIGERFINLHGEPEYFWEVEPRGRTPRGIDPTHQFGYRHRRSSPDGLTLSLREARDPQRRVDCRLGAFPTHRRGVTDEEKEVTEDLAVDLGSTGKSPRRHISTSSGSSQKMRSRSSSISFFTLRQSLITRPSLRG